MEGFLRELEGDLELIFIAMGLSAEEREELLDLIQLLEIDELMLLLSSLDMEEMVREAEAILRDFAELENMLEELMNLPGFTPEMLEDFDLDLDMLRELGLLD